MSEPQKPRLPDKDFHPELLSRRGEILAWTSTVLALAAWGVLLLRGVAVMPAAKFLAVALMLIALSISLGNWMDRRTVIHLDMGGVTFDNGVRHARLGWGEINRVEIFPSQWGKKVRVIGEKAHFDFRTLGEVKVQGELKGRMGFAQGEHILQQIVNRSGLHPVKREGQGVYYARE